MKFAILLLRLVPLVPLVLLGWSAGSIAAPDRSHPPTPTPPQRFVVPQPVELVLSNGIKVLFAERHRAAMVDVIATVDAGYQRDPENRYGLATWTQEMLTEGTARHDAAAFAGAQAAIAANISTDNNAERTDVSLHVGVDHMSEGLQLLADAIRTPRFDPADWRRVQQRMSGMMMMSAEDPYILADLVLNRALWGAKHRHGISPLGRPAALVTTTVQHLQRFHRDHYRPATTTLIVVGDVQRDQIQPLLERTFGDWQVAGKDPRPLTPSLPLKQDKRSYLLDVPGASQSQLRVGRVLPAGTPPWSPQVTVMNSILGGSQTSRLNLNLRETNHFTYGAGSAVQLDQSLVFSVFTAVETSTTGKAVAEIFKEMVAIQQPVRGDELLRAKGVQSLGFPGFFDNNRSVANLWLSMVSMKLPPTYLQHHLDDIAAVDVDGVRTAAQLLRAAMPVVVIGDAKAIAADVAAYGPVTQVTVEQLFPRLAQAVAKLGS